MEFTEFGHDRDLAQLREILASFEKTPAELLRAEEWLKAELKEAGENRLFFLATQSGHPIAMVQLVLNNADNDPELADGQGIAHIHHLRVRADQHRRGYARKMMEFLERRARELGKSVLTLGVDDFNTPAVALYKSLGYEAFKSEPGREPTEILFLMRKSLR